LAFPAGGTGEDETKQGGVQRRSESNRGHPVTDRLDTPEETRPFEGGMGKLDLVNTESGSPTWTRCAEVSAAPIDRVAMVVLPLRRTAGGGDTTVLS